MAKIKVSRPNPVPHKTHLNNLSIHCESVVVMRLCLTKPDIVFV